MNANSNNAKTGPADQTCPPCIPFCGLGDAGEAVSRLKSCGLHLLEQIRQPKDELPSLLSRS
ncbi:hypothetical protein [Humidesulfovibrio sp.]